MDEVKKEYLCVTVVLQDKREMTGYLSDISYSSGRYSVELETFEGQNITIGRVKAEEIKIFKQSIRVL